MTLEEKLVVLSDFSALIVNSSSGEHLREIHNASRGQLSFNLSLGGKCPIDGHIIGEQELFTVTPVLSESLLDCLKVDARGNVPKLLAAGLRTLASRLEQIAADVEVVEPKEYQHVPKVYVTRDRESNEVISTSLFIDHAGRIGIGYEDMTHAAAYVTCEPLQDWPELLADWEENIAGVKALKAIEVDGTDPEADEELS